MPQNKQAYLTEAGYKYISEELFNLKLQLEACEEKDLKLIQSKIRIYNSLIEGFEAPETDDLNI